MHNLHLARIKAKSHDEACKSVLSYISDWGNDNNWRSIGGAICEDGTGKKYDGVSRWQVAEEAVAEQIENLNKSCWEAIQGSEYLGDGILAAKIRDALFPSVETMIHEWTDWWKIYTGREFFNFLLNTQEARKECKESYDIFTSCDFFAFSYGNYGLTEMGTNGYTEEELKDCKTYVVLIDMHT